MIYKRQCPVCSIDITYNTYGRWWQANKRKSKCINCRNASRRDKRLGMKFDLNWINNLKMHHADMRGKNNPFYGKIHSEQTKLNISKARSGKCMGELNPSKRLEVRKKLSENCSMNNPLVRALALKNSKIAMKSPEVRKKMRENRLKQLANGNAVPSFNNAACQYFNELNETNNWNGIHALNGGEKHIAGYSVDYYEPHLNIVIEWDESHHYKQGVLREKDIIRQNNIINEIKCKFFRVKQDTLEMYEVTHEK